MVFRVTRVLEWFRDMEVRKLLGEGLWDGFPISWDSMLRITKKVHTGVDASDPSAFFLKPPFGGLLIIKA